jgi:hypothetical protein
VRKSSAPSAGFRYRLTDFLWWTRQEDVFKEIASLLNIETADTSTPGWFQLRTKASKNIIDGMNENEKKELENEVDRMQKDGLPPEIQRK